MFMSDAAGVATVEVIRHHEDVAVDGDGTCIVGAHAWRQLAALRRLYPRVTLAEVVNSGIVACRSSASDADD